MPTDIKRPQAIAVYLLQVSSVSSIVGGVGVGAPCVLRHHTALVNRKDERGCKSGIWHAEPAKEGGGLNLPGSGLNHHTLHGPPGPCAWALSARWHRL